jgi:ubiquinone biosynthesis accessory factor UbiK
MHQIGAQARSLTHSPALNKCSTLSNSHARDTCNLFTTARAHDNNWTIQPSRFNVRLMLDPKLLDDLSRQIGDGLPLGLRAFGDDLRRQIRASAEAALSRLDLVSREEFDIQVAVLQRTREHLAQLERAVSALEAALRTHPTSNPQDLS